MRTVIHMTFANPIIARAQKTLVNTQKTCRKAMRERKNEVGFFIEEKEGPIGY